MTKRVLITGGAGFIGSYLTERLLNLGYNVWVIDNLSAGSAKNIQHLLKRRNFRFVKGEISNKQLMKNLMKHTTRIWHLAATMGVRRIMEQPLESFKNNIESTHTILSLAANKKIPVLITSSSEVYGKNPYLPFEESADRIYGNIQSARWGYALAKAVNEFLALGYLWQKKLPCIIVRLFNVIGPRQTSASGMVVPTFVQQALSRKPITVYGDGTQTRCFVDVEDIVSSLITLMETKKAFGETFDVGSDEEIKMIELARLVKKLTKSSSDILLIPYKKVYNSPFEDVMRSKPSLTKIRKFINFKPNFTLKESLKKIIDYAKTNF
ncbi:MAG: UDP-glucose 4-epimerase [Parcubacteria group bacterium Gr01-1014_30]|nr:MAG: UDP-glucose 4-epimerase [Parcubacteria group bacterium Gr01-1014_30]